MQKPQQKTLKDDSKHTDDQDVGRNQSEDQAVVNNTMVFTCVALVSRHLDRVRVGMDAAEKQRTANKI